MQKSDFIRIQVLPLIYSGPNKYGDMKWMIQRPEYQDTLFIFNDNQQQFEAFQNWLKTGKGRKDACTAGGGNAIIRLHQCEAKPRAVGVPTGILGVGGYQNLAQAKPYIDYAFNYIKAVMNKYHPAKIAYSATANGDLATNIFSPSPEVKQYIVQQIYNLTKLYKFKVPNKK